jgi:hypothetical protein
MSDWEKELEHKIMDCWLLSSRAEVAIRLKAFFAEYSDNAYRQGCIDGWTAARDELQLLSPVPKFKTLQEFFDWKMQEPKV